MNPSESLSNQFLIAMPGMADPNFSTTVTLVCEHNAKGALGIIVNRPMELSLEVLLKQLDLGATKSSIMDQPILNGGPVAPERGFVLHSVDTTYENTLSVSDSIQLTLTRDVIDAMASGAGPDKSMVALGYAGWDAGQLEQEMLNNTWLTVPASSDVVFDVPFENRWAVAANTIGIDISRISPHAGRA